MVDAAQSFGLLLVLVGGALLIFEFVHPGVFLLVPGTVVLVAGVFYITVPGILTESAYGPALLGITAVVATVLSILWYQHLGRGHPPMVSMPSTLAGREGIVTAPVIPDSMKGKVRVDSEIWSARSRVPIPVGSRVRILGGEGVSIEVVPVTEESARAA